MSETLTMERTFAAPAAAGLRRVHQRGGDAALVARGQRLGDPGGQRRPARGRQVAGGDAQPARGRPLRRRRRVHRSIRRSGWCSRGSGRTTATRPTADRDRLRGGRRRDAGPVHAQRAVGRGVGAPPTRVAGARRSTTWSGCSSRSGLVAALEARGAAALVGAPAQFSRLAPLALEQVDRRSALARGAIGPSRLPCGVVAGGHAFHVGLPGGSVGLAVGLVAHVAPDFGVPRHLTPLSSLPSHDGHAARRGPAGLRPLRHHRVHGVRLGGHADHVAGHAVLLAGRRHDRRDHGVGLPKKANDARGNAKVALLFSDPTGSGSTGPRWCSCRARPTSTTRIWTPTPIATTRESAEKLPAAQELMPPKLIQRTMGLVLQARLRECAPRARLRLARRRHLRRARACSTPVSRRCARRTPRSPRRAMPGSAGGEGVRGTSGWTSWATATRRRC